MRGYFHFSAKRQFSYFRHYLPFSKIENENEDGFNRKFDAESNGDADGLPKPCSDVPIATLKICKRFLRQLPESLLLHALDKLQSII